MTTSNTGHGDVLPDGLIDDLSREMVKGGQSVNWLCRKLESAILAATQRAEPVAQSGVEGRPNLNDDGSVRRFFINPENGHVVETSRGPWVRYVDHVAALNAAPPAAVPCRDDGRCQYAIDHGAEGMGHCSPKCVMPRPAAPLSEGRDARLRAAMERMDRDGPMPGMIAAFEQQFGQTWTDRDWRQEASIWSAAWRAALVAPSPSPKPTDEATDAGRHQVIRDAARSTGYVTNSQAYDVADAVVAALAARPATPPDNAAGREGVNRG